MRPIAQNRPFTAHHSPLIIHLSPLTAHHSPLTAQNVLMSNPFGGICVSKKPRTLHADVPTLSSLTAHDSLPKNLFLLFFCRKIHKTVHKNAKNSSKNRLVHPSTIAPPLIKYLIIRYLILYNFVHCFSLSFLALILILQRKSFQNNI